MTLKWRVYDKFDNLLLIEDDEDKAIAKCILAGEGAYTVPLKMRSSVTENHFLAAAYKTSQRKLKTWEGEKKKLDRILKECQEGHHSPPSNYWLPEYIARKELETSLHIMNIVKTSEKEE